MKHPVRKFLTVAGSSLLLAALIHWSSLESLTRDLETQLTDTLPTRVIGSGIAGGSQGSEALNRYLASQISADLTDLQSGGWLRPLDTCHAQVSAFRSQQFDHDLPNAKILHLSWQNQGMRETIDLAFSCETNHSILLGAPLTLSALALMLGVNLHRPLTDIQQHCFRNLVNAGVSRREALDQIAPVASFSHHQRLALQRLLGLPAYDTATAIGWVARQVLRDERQLQWLEVALEHHNGDLKSVQAVLEADDKLVFLPERNTVQIHGIPIRLASTPFLYYLWYAGLRLLDNDPVEGGWFVNPPSNRPDRHNAQQLVQLMTDNGGHYKAINDLADKGLRARTLDQNRSKIKDEVTQVLGEALASDYLFAMARDLGTGRSQYRLAPAPERIQVDSAAIAALRRTGT